MSKPVTLSVSVPVTNKYTEKMLSCQGFFPLLFEINACHTTIIAVRITLQIINMYIP